MLTTAGNLVFQGRADGMVAAYRATDGKQLWDTVVPAGKIVVENIYHGYAVPTPVTDGEHVFVLFSSGVLASLDFNGKIVWREELPRTREGCAGRAQIVAPGRRLSTRAAGGASDRPAAAMAPRAVHPPYRTRHASRQEGTRMPGLPRPGEVGSKADGRGGRADVE